MPLDYPEEFEPDGEVLHIPSPVASEIEKNRPTLGASLSVQADSDNGIEVADEVTDFDMEMLHRQSRSILVREKAWYGELPPEHPLMQEVQELYKELNIVPEDRSTIHILPGNPKVNAMALPHGHMAFYAGCFTALPRFKEVWQALLAHEHIHISEEHSKKAIQKNKDYNRSPIKHSVLLDIAQGRLHEAQADIQGSVKLLNDSGINPLGAKMLFQALAMKEKTGWHHLSHGSSLDRMLNTQSIFNVYDLNALSHTLTEVDIDDADLDLSEHYRMQALRGGGFFLRRAGKRKLKEAQVHRLQAVRSTNLTEALCWIEYYANNRSVGEENIHYSNAEVVAVLNRHVDNHLEQIFPDLGEAKRKTIKWMLYSLSVEVKKSLYEQDEKSNDTLLHFFEATDECKESMQLDTLETILESDAFIKMPDIKFYRFDSLIKLVFNLALKENKIDMGSDDNMSANKEFFDKWSALISDFYAKNGLITCDEKKVNEHFKTLTESKYDIKIHFEQMDKNRLDNIKKLNSLIRDFKAKEFDIKKGLKRRIKIPAAHIRAFRKITKGMSIAEAGSFLNDLYQYSELQFDILIDEAIDGEIKNPNVDDADEMIRSENANLLIRFYCKHLALSALEDDSSLNEQEKITHSHILAGFFGGAGPEVIYEDYELVELHRRAKNVDLQREMMLSEEHDQNALLSAETHFIKLLFFQDETDFYLNKPKKILASMTTQTSTESIIGLCNTLKNSDEVLSSLNFDLGHGKNINNRCIYLIKKIICHYLSLFAGDKNTLIAKWQDFKKTGLIPEFLCKNAFKAYLNHFLYSVFSQEHWNLESPEDCLFLMELVPLVQDPELRLRLNTALVDSYLKNLSFQEKVDYLFGKKATGIRDFDLQRLFIENEVTSHEQLQAVQGRIDASLKDVLDEPSHKIGILAVLDRLSLANTTSVDVLELLLKSRTNDRDIKTFAFDLLARKYRTPFDGSEDISRKFAHAHMRDWVSEATILLSQIFNMSASHRYLATRQLLAGHKHAILSSESAKRRMFTCLLDNVLTHGENQVDVRSTIEDVVGVICKIPEWEELFFAIAPVIADNIALMPEQSVPWGDMYCVEEMVESYRHRRKRTILKPGKYNQTINEAAEASSGAIRDFLDKRCQVGKTREQMSPVGLVVNVAKHLGAPGVRFLQVLGQYIQIPTSYQREFDKVYDEVTGQNKLFADMTLEREWLEYRDVIESVDRTAGGGSIMTVFDCKTSDGGREVLKVRNPNILYRMELAFGFMQKIVDRLVEADPQRYGRLQDAFVDIREWIRHDIQDEGYLEKDRQFRAINEGFQPKGCKYRIRVPESKPPESEYVKRETYADGLNLTGWDQLEANGHNMKEVVALIAVNYFSQLMIPANENGERLVHADVHPGNFRVDKNNNVWILDRNGYHECGSKDFGLLRTVQLSGIADAFSEYFSDQEEQGKVREIVLDALGEEKDIGAKNIQDVICNLRKNGIKIPLKMTILLKNLNSLDRFAKKAGFDGLQDALSYQFNG